jgi:hypothetical protein
MILTDVGHGIKPATEAILSMGERWTMRFQECLAQSHGLKILWKDVQINNVLADDHGDTVIANFGGGNTIGWVDTDRCGAMAGTNRGH